MVSKTYTRTTCSGKIRVVVNRDDNKKFCSVQIYPPTKTNDCGCSFAFALQDLLTFALKRSENDHDVKLILKGLAGQHCMAMIANEHHAKSCVDHIAQVLKKEFLDAE